MKRLFISVDVEADGPCPELYSMISFGAVVVEPSLDRTFYGECKPISDNWISEALAISGHTREETNMFAVPAYVMGDFNNWIMSLEAIPMFVSDNNGFDWQFINYYFHRFVGSNPFGHSSTNLGSLYKGLVRDTRENFKHLRKTKHSHNPLDDAKGNAEAMLEIGKKINGFKIL